MPNKYEAKKEKDNDVIGSFYGKNRFVKIRADAFAIGKVHFSFVETDDKDKARSSHDYWMDIGKAALIAKEIIFGTMQKRAEAAVKSGDKRQLYAPLFQEQGGSPEAKANRRDGLATARVLSIMPSTSKGCPMCLRLEVGAGHSNAQGLIVPNWWSGSAEEKKKAKEYDYIIPLNNEGMPGYCHNGELDAFGVRLWMAIQAYFSNGLRTGEILTSNYNRRQETPVKNDPPAQQNESSGRKEPPTAMPAKNHAQMERRMAPAGSVTGAAPAQARTEWKFPEPVFPQGARVIEVVFQSAFTEAGGADDIYYAEVEVPEAGRQMYVWFEKNDLSRRLEEFTAAAGMARPVKIAIRIEPGTGDEKYCWFVA